MKTATYHLILLVLAAALLTGCGGMNITGAASPEDAAVRYVQGMKLANFTIHPGSVEAVQKIELTNRVLVMVQYNGTRILGRAETCQFVAENDKAQIFGWESHGGSGSCRANNDPTDTQPITAGGSRGSGNGPQDSGYSAVYGSVRDAQITRLMVTWSDGQAQAVDAQNGLYLAARNGGFDMQKVEALNDQGAVVFTLDTKAQRDVK